MKRKYLLLCQMLHLTFELWALQGTYVEDACLYCISRPER